MKKIILPIVIGLVIGLTIVISWTVFIFTLPSLDEQLKYSPFHNDGVWVSDEYDFKIYTEDYEGEGDFNHVYGNLNYQGTNYNLNFSYLSTRGFNHKYAAQIQIYIDDYDIGYHCYYEFNEDYFVLKKFYHYRGEDIFKNINEITFIKEK